MNCIFVLFLSSLASAAGHIQLRVPRKATGLSLATEAKVNGTRAAAIAVHTGTQSEAFKWKSLENLLDNRVYAAITHKADCQAKDQFSTNAPSARCKDLCENSHGCQAVCDEVRSMICISQGGPQVAQLNGAGASEAAAAAAAAATNAVRNAVKDAIGEVSKSAEAASAAAQASVKLAVQQASGIAKQAAHDTAQAAAAAAARSASQEAAQSAQAVASTAAAAATAAASASTAPAKAAAGGAAAPAPGPAPAGF